VSQLSINCPHEALRRIGGGRCGLCDGSAAATVAAATAAESRAAAVDQVAAAIERGRLAEIVQMHRSLAAFVRGAWLQVASADLEWNWHHDVLCRHLQYQVDEWRWRRTRPTTPAVLQKLAGNLPPGTGKSHITSVFLNAWVWLSTPEWRVTVVSSNDAVVRRDHGYLRRLISSDWYQRSFRPGWTIESDSESKGLITSKGGTRLSRSFLSGAVGLRGDALVIDDADDPKEVASPAYRRARDDKWRLTWYTRVNDLRVSTWTSIQQVTHEHGFTSILLPAADEADKHPDSTGWAHLCLPLRWRHGLPDTPIGAGDPRTVPGELLHPSRFPPSVIADLYLAMGTRGVELQYDQLRRPTEPKYFPHRWWRFFQRGDQAHYPPLYRPEHCAAHPARGLAQRSTLRRGVPVMVDDLDRVVISVDASFGANRKTASGEDASSRVGLGVMAAVGGRRLILDDRTEMLDYPETKAAIKALLGDYPEAHSVLIEEKANGAALIQELRRDPEIAVEIIAVLPTEGKRPRAIAHQPAIESGAVELLDGASWLDPVVGEFAAYTGREGERNDRIDWVTQALQHLATEGAPWWMR
jgi:predicted phage terminase large subunit-like protein